VLAATLGVVLKALAVTPGVALEALTATLEVVLKALAATPGIALEALAATLGVALEALAARHSWSFCGAWRTCCRSNRY